MSCLNYTELLVWQKAMELVEGIYQLTEKFPRKEMFGLTSQLRRSAVSVPSNITEGQGRFALGDFLQHLSIAHGSLRELETQLMIAQRLEFAQAKETKPLLVLAGDVGRLLNGLARSLRIRRTRGSRPITDSPENSSKPSVPGLVPPQDSGPAGSPAD
jgi:four helix bundle protein